MNCPAHGSPRISLGQRLAVALLAASAAAVAPAQTVTLGGRTGATVQPLLGVNAGPSPQPEAGNVDLTSHYRQRGVTLVRNHDFYGPLDMSTLYPDRSKDPLKESSYNFRGTFGSANPNSSDTAFAAILGGGFEPYFRIGDSYNNVKAPTSTELANWVQAAVQVLRHYREGQWSGFTSSFRFAEIGNEPDGETFWPKPQTADDFNRLYDQTAKALRTAFPTLKIGGPGWSPGGCLSPTAQPKVRSFLDYVKAQGSPLDFLSFHVYSTDLATYATCAQFYRSELDSRGLNAVELHISEWNTPNGAAGSTTGQLRYNAQGAAYLTAAWIQLQNSGVVQSTFYRGSDPAPNAPEFYGMFYGDGRAKKVADAFSLWRDFSAYPRVLQTSGAPSGVTAMAAETDAGARALLVANPQATSTTLSLALGDGKTAADYRLSASTVSDSAAGLQTTTLSTAQLSIPAKATVLLRLTPKNNAFAASATASGSLAAHTVTLKATLAAADVGSSGSIHVAALAGATWWAYDGRSWSAWTSGELPAVFQGNLPSEFSLTPISGIDVRSLSGITIYLGYGRSVDEMIASGRYTAAYRIP